MKNKRVVTKYMVILSSIFFLLITLRIFLDIQHRNDMIHSRQEILAGKIERSFESAKDNLIKAYQLVTIHYMQSPIVSNFVKQNKTEELHRLLENDYLLFKKEDPNLFVMHFFDTKNITILRMHKPGSFGDDLSEKRPIVAYVNKSLKKQFAFEVGKNGIVYRITSPFIHNKEHLGALEFGIKPSYFSHIINDNFNTSSVALVKTEKLGVLVAKKSYPTLENYSIISKDNVFNKIKGQIDLSKSKQIVESNGKTYLIFNNLNLENYTGEVVFKILVAKDITHIVDENNQRLALINTLSVTVFIGILLTLYIALSRFALDIRKHQKTINTLSRRSEYLKNRANTDELTGLYNKGYFDRFITTFVNKEKYGSILFFDIDHFKKLNDTYGHFAGDEVLKNLTATVKTLLRDEDVFVRWGGEEFIVLIEDINLIQAVHKAEDIRILVESSKLYDDLTTTISIGVAELEKNESKDLFLERADKLLYDAKHSGRNCVKH